MKLVCFIGMASLGTDSGNTIITYKIEYNKYFPGTVKQLQADDAIYYAAKDFLTFIFCGLNDEYLEKVKAQLKDKGLMIKDMNGTTVTCRVTTPIDQQSQLQVKNVIHDIQASVLSMQDQLDFEKLPWPESREIVNSLLKSPAKENNLLQIHLNEKVDQSQVMLVYDRSCRSEISKFTSTLLTTNNISMEPCSAKALLKLGLYETAENQVGCKFVINAVESGLSVSIKQEWYSVYIDKISRYISEFDRSVYHRSIKCPVQHSSVLELSKVRNGLRNAVAPYKVCLEVDLKRDLHLFSQSEDAFTDSERIIQEILVELKILITKNIKEIQRNEKWKTFTESIEINRENNEFILFESGKDIEITGLKGQVETIIGFINGLKDVNTESINDETQKDANTTSDQNANDDLPIDDIEKFSYLKRFYKPPEKVHLRHYYSQARQGFHLTGPAIEVQKAKKHLHHFLNTISVRTFKFNDNGYLNTDDGLQFLQDKIIRDCTVLFAFTENKHSLSSQGTARSEKACSIDGTDDSDKKMYRWEKGRKCKVVLMVADDVEAEVSIQIVEHKTKKGKWAYTRF